MPPAIPGTSGAALLGAHMPTGARGLGGALRDGAAIGCTAVQVFTKSPRTWRVAEPSPEALAERIADFRAARLETGIDALASHDSYLINLAAPDPDLRARSIEGLKGELARSAELGIPLVVSHVGARMGAPPEEALARAADGLRQVLGESDPSATLCMETTAGQGSSMNATFEELASLLEACGGAPRLAVCLDTCHIFAAGYDVRTAETFAETFQRFDATIGFDRLKLIHANDSKKGLGSRVDRHENLGEGELGETAFKLLVRDPRFARIPIVVETPIENSGHAKDVARLIAWANDR